MGQKSNPYLLRLGINQVWNSNYLAPKKEQVKWLKQDKTIRNYLFKRFFEVTQVKIERTLNDLFLYVYAINISLLMGENSQNLDKILKKIYSLVDDKVSVRFNLMEVKEIYSSAPAIARHLASQFESRISSRMSLNNAADEAIRQREVKGVRISASGRLDGSEIAQSKKIVRGRMPLSTLRSDIDYGFAEATTNYGKIGIMVLIYKGEKYAHTKNKI